MNWKAIVIGVIFYVSLGTFFGNYFKAGSGFIATVIIALITGVITALVAKKQFVRHGIWSGFLGGILIGVTLVIMITSFPWEARVLFPSDEIDALRNNIELMFLMTTALFTIFGIIGSGIGSFITGLIYKKIKGEEVEKEKRIKIISIKNFFKPNKWKIALSVALIIIAALPTPLSYVLALPSVIISGMNYGLYKSIWPSDVLLSFLYLYTISCVIILIYDKFKKKK
jgi:uncharacterized membrane protein YciS (DUF1049 family)